MIANSCNSKIKETDQYFCLNCPQSYRSRQFCCGHFAVPRLLFAPCSYVGLCFVSTVQNFLRGDREKPCLHPFTALSSRSGRNPIWPSL